MRVWPVARRRDGTRSLAIMTALTKVSANATPATSLSSAAVIASETSAQAM